MKATGVLSFILAAVFILSSCSKEPDPADQFKLYVDSWQKQNYEEMYRLLSDNSKNNIDENTFTDRYRSIYDGINASNLRITFTKPKEKVEPDKDGKVSFIYQVKMNTLGGPIDFTHKATLVKEKRDKENTWVVNWSPDLIFPQLQSPGDEVRVSTEKAIRGDIVDRNGDALATNGSVYQIGIVPMNLGDDKEKVIKELGKELGVTVSAINQKLNASWVKSDYFVPIKSIQKNENGKIARLMKLKGVTKKEVVARVYPYKQVFAHLTGYVGPISAEELKTLKSEGYTSTDKIGKRGLELLYDKRLRGEDGCSVFVVDQDGNKVDTIAEKPAKNGETIKLTVDVDTQMALYRELKGDAGTAVALDPKSGRILGLASSPSFDPNDFIVGISHAEWQKLNNDKQKPLTNRFVQKYAPGSTFKPVTASIALDNGVLKPSDTLTIKNPKWQKDSSWGTYYVKRVSNVTSPMKLEDAFVYSDNIFFAQTALKVGADPFIKGAQKFGIEEKLPMDYPFEKSTVSNNGKIASEIQLADSGYGQGQVSLNPLHLALIYSAFVNNGNMMKPLLILDDQTSIWKKQVVTPENANIVLNDLKQVVKNSHGTAHAAYMPDLPLAGKTGTAEFKTKQGEKGKENGWFVAVNTKQPNLLVGMMIENVQDRNGSHYVVPKVKEVFKTLEK